MSDRSRRSVVLGRLRAKLTKRKQEFLKEEFEIKRNEIKIKLEKEITIRKEEKKSLLYQPKKLYSHIHNNVFSSESWFEKDLPKVCIAIVSEYLMLNLLMPINWMRTMPVKCTKIVVAASKIFVLSQRGVYCFDLFDGKLVWYIEQECLNEIAVSQNGQYLVVNDCRHLSVCIYTLYDQCYHEYRSNSSKYVKYVEKMVVDNGGNVYMQHSQTYNTKTNFVDFHGRESDTDIIRPGINDMQFHDYLDNQQLFTAYSDTIKIYSLQVNYEKNTLNIVLLQTFTTHNIINNEPFGFFIHEFYFWNHQGEELILYDRYRGVGRIYNYLSGEFKYSFKNNDILSYSHPLYPWHIKYSN